MLKTTTWYRLFTGSKALAYRPEMVMPPIGVGPKLVSVLSVMKPRNESSHTVGLLTLCSDKHWPLFTFLL